MYELAGELRPNSQRIPLALAHVSSVLFMPGDARMITVPTINCARAIRDGGIDAVAALNEAVRLALVDAPPESHDAIKLAIGRLISAVLEATVNPAVEAFPELEPDVATWIAVASARAAARSNP
jgi:hypothetical protein